MKLGLGLYKQLLTDDNFRFAKQSGATHIVAQLVDYVKGDDPTLTQNYLNGWGITRNEGKLWSYEELKALKVKIESHGLTLAAIENFDPAHWYDILLDGPKKKKQTEDLKTIIRNVGKAGIPMLGYYFSLAGVWGWSSGPYGRGGAGTVGYEELRVNPDQPIPNGMVWNMTYDPGARGFVPSVEREEMWGRLRYFLDEMLPVAEACGVRLVAHPDDPPVPTLRGTARLFYNTDEYENLLQLYPGNSNGFEFCIGTIQEMQGSNVYDMLDRYSRSGQIGYIHFRNVIGKVPHYREAFVDEGDINMVRAMKILKRNNYQGVLIPDHTPEMSCRGPWHAGMAYALGYLRGVIQTLDDVDEV